MTKHICESDISFQLRLEELIERLWSCLGLSLEVSYSPSEAKEQGTWQWLLVKIPFIIEYSQKNIFFFFFRPKQICNNSRLLFFGPTCSLTVQLSLEVM